MRLMFICGSLEPGRDGVGDYIRRLSGILIKKGHDVHAIAFNDLHVKQISWETQIAEDIPLSVLRLPAVLPEKRRTVLAADYINDVAADTISLQFVPYSFHRKGLPLSLWKNLRELIRHRKFHIFFHEIWLDAPVGMKQKITALLQRALIRKLITTLKPDAINVSVPFEKDQLGRIHVQSDVLSLFGNVYPETAEGRRSGNPETDVPSLLYFGTVPKGAFKEIFINKVAEFFRFHQQPLKLIFACGNSGVRKEFYKELDVRLQGQDYEIVDCGFMSATDASKLMSQCQAGISKSKPHLLGKSGAAVAMLEHGLPLWMPRWDGETVLSGGFRNELIFSDLTAAIQSEKIGYYPLLNEVAEEFIQKLTCS
jgi:hypothetical protein